MKIQLDKELRKESKKEVDVLSSPLNEVKQILLSEESVDLGILRNLAGKSELVTDEVELGKQIELEKLNTKFGETFTIQQIESIARKYYLRFLNSNLFKGKMGLTTIAKIKEFSNIYEVSLNEYDLQKRFFILAPAKVFEMNTTRLTTLKDQEREEKRQRRLALDPVLFYKIDENHYRLVHKWGNDLNISRLISGYIFDNPLRFQGLLKKSSLLFGMLVSYPVFKWLSSVTFQDSFTWTLAHVALAVIITAMSIGLYFILKSIWWDTTSQTWRPRSEFFSKHNWRSINQIKLF